MSAPKENESRIQEIIIPAGLSEGCVSAVELHISVARCQLSCSPFSALSSCPSIQNVSKLRVVASHESQCRRGQVQTGINLNPILHVPVHEESLSPESESDTSPPSSQTAQSFPSLGTCPSYMMHPNHSRPSHHLHCSRPLPLQPPQFIQDLALPLPLQAQYLPIAATVYILNQSVRMEQHPHVC